MNKIRTWFGEIYIENLGDREEFERIKLYDSDKKYLDYISYESLEDNAKTFKTTVEEEYLFDINYLKNCDDLTKILTYIGMKADILTTDWKQLVILLDHSSKEDLMFNECVNRIGDFYIVSC